MADDRGPEILAVFYPFLVLVVPSTLLRLYTMQWILRRFYLEDWIAAFSLVGLPPGVSHAFFSSLGWLARA
jgi:hypothetical protein